MSASYLGVGEFLLRADVRSVGRLCSMTATPIAPGALSGDPVLAAALIDAGGLVLAACCQGDRYNDADLSGLNGSPQAKLFRLIAQLTVCLLWENRMLWDSGSELPRPLYYERAYEDLDRLRAGERMFAM